MGFLDRIIRFFQDKLNKLTDEEKRRLILICTAVFAAVLTLSVIMSIRGSGGEENLKRRVNDLPERQNLNAPIPADELFLPDEPDFLPGVLLERERRTSWSEEDADEYWQDPLRFGEEEWRKNIEAAIDDLLERIP